MSPLFKGPGWAAPARFLVLSLGLAVFGLAAAPPSSAQSSAAGGPAALLEDAGRLVRREALSRPDEERAAAQALRGYLRAVDNWSTYLSPAEFRSMTRQDQVDYSGIGLDIISGPAGEIFCVPFAAGPAHKAGIQYGDRLLAVGERSVLTEAPEILPGLIRGAAGTRVTLTVAGANGLHRRVTVTRADIHRPLVDGRAEGQVLTMRIYRFEPETPALVRRELEKARDQARVVIDLRGNIGGDLRAAIETAALFLPPGSHIVTVARRADLSREPEIHRAGEGSGRFAARRLVIWQDQLSASASEVFIAALTHHGRAVSLGRRSFGKGVSQSVFPAPGGGLYILTTGELIPPNGLSFNGRGLEPGLPLGPADPDDDFYRRTGEIFAVPFQAPRR